jgi:poly-gamma-glutamate synthesis protein (capsule biosynthesis protein)
MALGNGLKQVKRLIAAGIFLMLAGSSSVYGQNSGRQPSAARDENKELALKITQPFTVATVGDLIEPQPIARQNAGFQQLVDIIRSADVGFANMESSLVNITHFPGPIAGTMAPMSSGQAIKDMGIKIVNHANNHAVDGGIEGMFSTIAALDALGIVHAGTGKDLEQARAAQYLETPKGRVGVVGMFAVDDVGHYGENYRMARATYRVDGVGGAPGINQLHLTDYHIVTTEQLQSLREIRNAIWGPGGDPTAAKESPDTLKLLDDWYMAGDHPGEIKYRMNVDDEKEILKSIRNGKIYADFMIATIHAHQTAEVRHLDLGPAGGPDSGIEHLPPDYLVQLAHDCIDNGADMFVAHGVHSLHGVEIYKDKPVFYGLSNFVFQFGIQYGASGDILANEKGLSLLENPASNESILAVSQYDGGRLVEVRLYPVDLGGARRPISLMGIPMMAPPEMARTILAKMQEWSHAFGTKIAIEGSVGVIRLAGANQVH